jgi:hypothetical protein
MEKLAACFKQAHDPLSQQHHLVLPSSQRLVISSSQQHHLPHHQKEYVAVHPVDMKVGRRVAVGHTALTREEPLRSSHALPHSLHALPLYALPPHVPRMPHALPPQAPSPQVLLPHALLSHATPPHTPLSPHLLQPRVSPPHALPARAPLSHALLPHAGVESPSECGGKQQREEKKNTSSLRRKTLRLGFRR